MIMGNKAAMAWCVSGCFLEGYCGGQVCFAAVGGFCDGGLQNIWVVGYGFDDKNVFGFDTILKLLKHGSDTILGLDLGLDIFNRTNCQKVWSLCFGNISVSAGCWG